LECRTLPLACLSFSFCRREVLGFVKEIKRIAREREREREMF
jgi:hypothetical protein